MANQTDNDLKAFAKAQGWRVVEANKKEVEAFLKENGMTMRDFQDRIRQLRPSNAEKQPCPHCDQHEDGFQSWISKVMHENYCRVNQPKRMQKSQAKHIQKSLASYCVLIVGLFRKWRSLSPKPTIKKKIDAKSTRVRSDTYALQTHSSDDNFCMRCRW